MTTPAKFTRYKKLASVTAETFVVFHDLCSGRLFFLESVGGINTNERPFCCQFRSEPREYTHQDSANHDGHSDSSNETSFGVGTGDYFSES